MNVQKWLLTRPWLGGTLPLHTQTIKKLPMGKDPIELNRSLLMVVATTWRVVLAAVTQNANDILSTMKLRFPPTLDICLHSMWEDTCYGLHFIFERQVSKETGQGATPLTRPTTGVMAHRTRDRSIGLSCPGKTIFPQGCRVHIDCPLQTYSPELKGNLFIAWLKNSLTTRMPCCVTSCRWMDLTENLRHLSFQALQKMVESMANGLLEAPTGWGDAKYVYVGKPKNNLVCL